MPRGINDEDDGDKGFVVSEEATIVGQTERSWRIDIGRHDFLPAEVTIPKSQVHPDSEVFDIRLATRGRLLVTTWLAEQRGWIEGEDNTGKKRGAWFGVPAPASTPKHSRDGSVRCDLCAPLRCRYAKR